MRGINITGEIMIFKNDKGYSTTISNKNINGEYENMYVTIQLPKGDELENKQIINIAKGFMSFYKDKNGLAKPKLVVQEYAILGIEDIQIQDNDVEMDLPF